MRTSFLVGLVVATLWPVDTPRSVRGVHPGPPVHLEVVIAAERVEFRFSGEQATALAWFRAVDAAPLAADEVPPFVSDPLGPDQDRALRAEIERFFAAARPFEIDGSPVDVELVDLRVPSPELTEFGMPALDWSLRARCARAPTAVTVRWRQWDRMECEGELRLPILFRDRDRSQLVFVDEREPEFTWRSTGFGPAPPPAAVEPLVPAERARFSEIGTDLAIALLGIALLALARLGRGPLQSRWRRGLLTAIAAALIVWPVQRFVSARAARSDLASVPESARVIFERLHRGIYDAFDGGDEGEIYARLSAAAIVEIVPELYGDIFESLILRSKGGVLCRIEQIDYTSEEIGTVAGTGIEVPERLRQVGAATFTVRCRWRVDGTVSHWGHMHRRVNEYDAEYLVALDGDAWKLAAVRILDHRRLDRDG